MGDVGDLEQERTHLLVGFLHLGVQPLDVVRSRAHLLAHLGGNGPAVLLPRLLRAAPVRGLELLALVDQLAALDVEGYELAHEFRAALLGDGTRDLLRALSEQPDVEHAATPSPLPSPRGERRESRNKRGRPKAAAWSPDGVTL